MEASQITSVQESLANRVPHLDHSWASVATISPIPAAIPRDAAQDTPFWKVWA